MKKYTPYILPLIVILVVFVLIYRWYDMRTERMTSSLLDEGVVIENLSEDELQKTLSEASDFATVEMTPVKPEGGSEAKDEDEKLSDAVIRYDVSDGKLKFSVIGTFPESSEEYQVFLRDLNDTVTRHAFTLEDRKGGLVGSASVSADVLPVEVIVARGGSDKPGEIVLRGTIEAPVQE